MPAIQSAMFNVLKKTLNERYVPYLPPLLGDANAAANKKDKQIARALSAFTLQTLFAVDPKTAAEAVVDDYNDNGVDAIYYNEADKTLYFVQSKLKANEQFQLAEAQSFLSGIKLLIAKQYDNFNQNVKNLSVILDKALDECDQIKLIITYTGDDISIQARNEIKRVIKAEIQEGEEQLQLEIIDFGPQKIEEALRQEKAIKLVNDKIRIHKYCSVEGQRKTYFGIVKISDLIKLHNRHGKSLYDKNIRYFIGSGKRGVNSAIKETLKNEPQHFLHLNNGITIVGNSIKQRSKSHDEQTTRDFEVLGMSVVNGAQTISIAAQFISENPETDISKAQVILTLIETGSDGFHKEVTKARNLQNPVDLSNFVALDDDQERLRQEMALYGVEYHYRTQRQLSSNVQIIEIETLTKALACRHNDIRFPAKLKSDPSTFTNSSSTEYQILFTPNLTGLVAINSVNVYLVIQELTSTAEKSSPSPERLVYRHCGYAIAYVLMRHLKTKIEGDEILETEKIKLLISTIFDEVRQKFADRYLIDGIGTAHHSFFKRIPDTAKLMQNVCISQQKLSDDMTVAQLYKRLKPQDTYNQALSNYLSDKAAQL